jgi:serine/threonine protein phosphatase 1
MSKFIQIRKNNIGIDYFVGDIHGCYTLLEQELKAIGFDKTKDRLFVLGDLTDRGPESYLAPEYLNQKWFIAIQGNHDAFVYHTAKHFQCEELGIKPLKETDRDVATCISEGGSWLVMQTLSTLNEVIRTFSELPILIEYQDEEGKPLAGLIHAEAHIGMSWQELVSIVSKLPSDYVFSLEDDHKSPVGVCLWGRDKNKVARKVPPELRTDDMKMSLMTPGIPVVISGHTPIKHEICNGPLRYENNRVIDHGIYKGGGVHIYTLDQLV